MHMKDAHAFEDPQKDPWPHGARGRREKEQRGLRTHDQTSFFVSEGWRKCQVGTVVMSSSRREGGRSSSSAHVVQLAMPRWVDPKEKWKRSSRSSFQVVG